jgi:RNA-directed DNA polymerase
MEKTHITHVDDWFVFLGHRIIRKRESHGRLSVVTTIPKEKAKTFARRLVEALSGFFSLRGFQVKRFWTACLGRGGGFRR